MVETANGDMKQVNAHEVPYWEPFLVEGSSGRTISVFFYHPRSGQLDQFRPSSATMRIAMYRTIRDIREADRVPLINTATDGEIYGHHEPFGDMALAALVKEVV